MKRTVLHETTPISRLLLLLAVFLAVFLTLARSEDFRSAWPLNAERIWVGPQYWAGPMQDWRLAGGRLECYRPGPDRKVDLLTRQVGKEKGSFSMDVRLGQLDKNKRSGDASWVGFRVGSKGPLNEYRNNALWGNGLDAGISGTGILFIRDPGGADGVERRAYSEDWVFLDDVELRLYTRLMGTGVALTLSARNSRNGDEFTSVTLTGVPMERLSGNVALVCHSGGPGGLPPGNQGNRGSTQEEAGPPLAVNVTGGAPLACWFRDWRVSGSSVEAHPEQTFGPILWAMYTQSRGVLKITAQMPPIGVKDPQLVRLDLRETPGSDVWSSVGEARIDPLSRTATFRIPDWNASTDVSYRLSYPWKEGEDKTGEYHWGGTIRHDPVEKDTVSVAGFTGNMDYAFPNTRTVENVRAANPDLLFFSGDQIYEPVARYGATRQPLDIASLDYLRKWYLLGWAFGDLMRDRPTVTIPDDHDVYQGNIWGAGGRKTNKDDRGGYLMPAEWVNMGQRTQTSHLPDPYDPTPVEQGIGVYYCPMTFGRVSFAILEDRKFKSGPAGLAPETTSGRADHVIDPSFDPATADVPGAELLGGRQLRFLGDWAADWRGADMKVALSQTTFAQAAHLSGKENYRLVADYDSNGWPQTGRNKALAQLRRGFAFHLCGDTHLPIILQYGIDEWRDAGFAFAVPSIAAGYPRAWAPLAPGENREEGMPDYTGDFRDGFGNRITVWAVANPKRFLQTGETPPGDMQALNDKSSGFGLVYLNKKERTIRMECWPILSDLKKRETAEQFPGWPKTIGVFDNYGRNAVAWLPTLRFQGMDSPVVQVIAEPSQEIVYSVRAKGSVFRPKVFQNGVYTLKIGEPGTKDMKLFVHVASLEENEQKDLEIRF